MNVLRADLPDVGSVSPLFEQTDDGKNLKVTRNPDQVQPESVSSRADGRPPEEASSDDPETQARVILEESEERLTEGAAKSLDD